MEETLVRAAGLVPGGSPEKLMTIRVGFKYDGKYLLGLEIKVKPQGDVFVFVFERGHRRLHVSYHKDGRVNHNADRPNEEHVPISWDMCGKMEPMIRDERPVNDIRGRQRVAGTGWATEDIGRAQLPEFVPQPDDIVVEPKTATTGFSVNIISPDTAPRSVGHLGQEVLSRYTRGVAPIIEIETYDWLAPQAPPKLLVTSFHKITPGDGVWLLDDDYEFSAIERARQAAVERYGEPHATSRRNDGGINLYYQRLEDDTFEI